MEVNDTDIKERNVKMDHSHRLDEKKKKKKLEAD